MVRTGQEDVTQPSVVSEVPQDGWDSKRSANVHNNNNMVTLTKSQLKAILDAIGQVGALNIGDGPIQASVTSSEEGENENMNDGHGEYSNGQDDGRGFSPAYPPTVEQCSPEMAGPPLLLKSNYLQRRSSSQSEMYIDKSFGLSKVEQKRLQWEKEKAEMQDWNPWGRPGAGAPVRKVQAVAPVAHRSSEYQLLPAHTSSSVPYEKSVSNIVTNPLPSPPAHHAAVNGNVMQGSPTKGLPNYGSLTPQLSKPVPPAMKSSLPFGPSSADPSVNEVDDRKKQWLQELEGQREEQRIRRLMEQEQLRLSRLRSAEWINGESYDKNAPQYYDPNESYTVFSDKQGRNYARGKGFALDPEAAALAESRRQKAQEYQQAIQLQMEEKQRRLQEERMRKVKEEQEEEKRLEEERARLQAQYEQEQQRQKLKEELEEKKREVLMDAMQKAQMAAEAAKKAKKSQKLQPLFPHSESGLQEKLSPVHSPPPVHTPKQACSSDQSNIMSHIRESGSTLLSGRSEVAKVPQQTATVRPVQTTDLNCSTSVPLQTECYSPAYKEFAVQANFSSPRLGASGYIENRILTPSKLRIRAREMKGREFGTQTDVDLSTLRWLTDDADAESVESTTSSVHSSSGRKNRVQHSKPTKAFRKVLQNDNEWSQERPKWGANQPMKSYVKMSERDPHFTKRKKLQELRKQHWEREMATQRAMTEARRSSLSCRQATRSRTSLHHSRAATSSDGTAGFSSSETESRPHHRRRSESPPVPALYKRISGFRPSLGSADDVTLMNRDMGVAYSLSSPSTTPLKKNWSHSIDNLPSIVSAPETHFGNAHDRLSLPGSLSYNNILPPMRRQWHSQENFFPHHNMFLSQCSSPPVPAVQKRIFGFGQGEPPVIQVSRRKWSDQESFDLENVALTRAIAHHRESSEESSKTEEEKVESQKRSKRSDLQNPLVHPEVVTGRPTPRQDKILQQLSTLRQGLLLKQRELENLIRRPPEHTS